MNAEQAEKKARMARMERMAREEREFKEVWESQADERNLIPESDVKTIKNLLKKLRRTEDEWDVIRDILGSHSIIYITPIHPKVKTCNRMLVDDGRLMAFTNFNDATAYCKDFVRREIQEGLQVQMGSMPFDDATEIADKEGMELFIDHPVDEGMFLLYSNGRIRATMCLKIPRK